MHWSNVYLNVAKNVNDAVFEHLIIFFFFLSTSVFEHLSNDAVFEHLIIFIIFYRD